MLLHFVLVLHFAAIVITFCVSITFCGDYYILRRNRVLGAMVQQLSYGSFYRAFVAVLDAISIAVKRKDCQCRYSWI